MENLEGKKIGLALSGGAVLGAAHIGVLKALEEFKISIDYISGTSIGAFIASMYAFGLDYTKVKEIALELSWKEISSFSFSKLGLFSNRKIKNFLTENIGDVTFNEASIPLAIIAANISKGSKVIIKEGEVSSAVMASCCIPGLFQPVEVEGQLLVDGGIVENVPISPLKDFGANFIIAVDLNAKYDYTRPNNIVDVLLNSFHFTLASSTKLQTEKADLLIQPDLSSFNHIDVKQTEDLIQVGFEEAKKVLNQKINVSN